jgi:hexosaminidase
MVSFSLVATPPRRRVHLAHLCATLLAVVGCGSGGAQGTSVSGPAIIPAPGSMQTGGDAFTLVAATPILTQPGSPEVARIGSFLAGILRPSTGFPVPVSGGGDGTCQSAICLTIGASDRLGDEGYQLDVSSTSVRLTAARPEGLFRGVQTIRQLLPARIESRTVQRGPWTLPGVRIEDRPRFAWRGAGLDVARHFLSAADVERYIDEIALYKINVLHLHLTDDQGWRLEIASWPKLATVGGKTQVGGGQGGSYTQKEYADIVRYAQDRYVTVVPEIDMPGHTNAALVSYPELDCSGRPPAPYTGIEVGFSSLCLEHEFTYHFLDQVIGEVAALTPGPYIHIGGDEARTVPHDRYAAFIERMQGIVESHGKRMIGWQEVATTKLRPSSVAQFWDTRSSPGPVRDAAARGTQLVLSPASRIYLDMKYDLSTRLGMHWAGYVEVRDAYDWDPAALLTGVGEAQVLGVEAPLWSETIENLPDVEYMAFPRLAGVAEIGWSPAKSRSWAGYRQRLAAHGPRWTALGVNFYRSPQVPWPA